MIQPNITKLVQQEGEKIWIVNLLQKDNDKPKVYHQAIQLNEMIVFAEDYNDERLPQNPFVFGHKFPINIMAKKNKHTKIYPIITFSPLYLIWLCLVKDCNTLKEKLKLLKQYSEPDLIVIKTDDCEIKNLVQEFAAPTSSEIPELTGPTIDLIKFHEFTFLNKTLYIHSQTNGEH